MKVIRGKIRTKVSPMAPDRSIFHESVLEEDLLAGDDVISCENSPAIRANDLFRNWGSIPGSDSGNPRIGKSARRQQGERTVSTKARVFQYKFPGCSFIRSL